MPVKWTPSYFALTHQKTLLVDGRAYILTFNLTPQYYASTRDFGVIDTIAADAAAVRRTFDADWSGQRITAPNGADLVWSPGSEQAQVSHPIRRRIPGHLQRGDGLDSRSSRRSKPTGGEA